jgi:hypothetical protein
MYTFVLTPFTELPKYERSNEYFLGTTNLSINLLLTSYIYSSSNKNPLMFVYRCHWVALTDAVQFTTSIGNVWTKRIIQLMDLR